MPVAASFRVPRAADDDDDPNDEERTNERRRRRPSPPRAIRSVNETETARAARKVDALLTAWHPMTPYDTL